ncbi:MAG: DUF2461 domain-containing protein [Eubacteriales bacterium]|nr:DUF2461 domain-containing protein [Eubacteriales bacterium]
MIFDRFTPQMLDFLAENHIRNSKEWYEAHKKEYRELVVQPYHELVERMAPTMTAIDPLFVTQPSRCLSRVRRDTRYTKNKDLYRDHAWIVFRHARKRLGSALSYYFGVDQDAWSYGVGYYDIPRDVLAECQDMILKEDRYFRDAFAAVQGSDFLLEGERYKRLKYPDAPEKYQDWLSRKQLSISFTSEDFDLLFAGEFYDKMITDIQKMQPFYEFLQKAEERARAKQSTGGLA